MLGEGAGQRPEGVDDLFFHICGEFSPPPSSNWDLGLWAGIWTSRLDLGLEAGILAWRLEFGPPG